ncbi:MAG: cation-translocating P-type ATPase [Anaerolineae bacterium]|nr:cation-translocating P-type ATPase [Anaerolineae bacterium]MDW8099623.1 cation-translocating P-type ATPase [Anaerolineae bacterium]
MAANWHRLEIAEVLALLKTEPERGLTQTEAQRRLAEYGPNELVERGLKSPWLILWEQLTAVMVMLLIIAAVISAALGDYKDTAAILAIVVLNAILGFTQEYRAEKAMAALKKLAVPTVKVRRDGHVREISARELVPGDIVFLEAGGLVPADGRLLESVNLRTQEAALTGESEPVEKDPTPLTSEDLPLGDRRNMVYMGTVITYGRGLAVVTETGMRTELGRIAEMIQKVEREPTPLQRRLEQLGHGLALGALAIVAVVFILGLLRGEELRLMFLTALSMAVAAVPEGLPAVVTIALALGAQRMLKRHALIRKLPAVETLGSVTVICSDKTGTLTENRMTVAVLDVAGHTLNLTEALHRGQPIWMRSGNPHTLAGLLPETTTAPLEPALQLLLGGAALCNDAILETTDDGSNGLRVVGDPTEGALVIAAAQFGLLKAELERALPRVAEVPFTSERKRMTTVHQASKGRSPLSACLPDHLSTSYLVFTKGAVDSLLEVSKQVWVEGQIEGLTEDWRRRIQAANNRLAQDGMRVLGVAFRPLEALPAQADEETLERDLIFMGLVGMIDPPRPEVKEAVQTCKAAGIRPVMITGDHPLTAQHIARELGIATDGRVLTGQELASMSVEELETVVEEVSIYARVSPEHKLKIVEALQDRGHIVAMTGDGVNDAPALKKADIGVAMGITGTDVSKEAADMVLLDDNFATIVAAVEEGRVIYDNIRKFIKYTMTSNAGEIWTMLLAPFLGMPLPLLPLQILWINLVTDGLPGLALTVEPAERDTMRRPPYHPKENIFGRGMGRHILWVGLLMGLVSLGMGFWAWRTAHPTWQTMVFTTLTLSQMGHALAIRSGRDSLFRIGLLSNRPLLGAVLLTFVLQLAVIYVPFLQGIFKTVALPASDLAISLVLSTVVFWGVELEKWLLRRHG